MHVGDWVSTKFRTNYCKFLRFWKEKGGKLFAMCGVPMFAHWCQHKVLEESLSH